MSHLTGLLREIAIQTNVSGMRAWAEKARQAIALAEEMERQLVAAQAALKQSRLFMEYARYELEPKHMSGEQFPCQECCDKKLAIVDDAIANGTAALAAHDERVRRETARETLLEVLTHEERCGVAWRDHNEMVVSSDAVRAMSAALDDIDWGEGGGNG